jgi:hypothetical protein
MAEWHTFHSCSNATHGCSWANRFSISCSYRVILGSGSEKCHVLSSGTELITQNMG